MCLGLGGGPCDRCEGRVTSANPEKDGDKRTAGQPGLQVKIEGSERALCMRCLTANFQAVRALLTPFPPAYPTPGPAAADVIVIDD